MGNNIRSSSRPKALAPSIPIPPLADAMDAVHLSVDRFCLLAGVEALAEMMEEDATTVCGARHRRHGDRRGYRWGRTHSEIGYHGGKVKVARPRVRDRAGKEVSLESWQALRDGNLLLEWALNLMVLNVSTCKYHRAVRLPEGDLAKARGDGTSKSAVSRRFVALSRKKMKAWLASDLSELDLLVIQIDGLHVGDHVLMAAIGVDGNGDKHVLAGVEGATENTVVVQALIDNLLARGLDPTLPRLFIVDGAKALSKAIRNTFGVAAAIQRCQVHKGRNIIERLPQHLHASVKKALRQAWDQDDANKAERLLRNLVRRLEHEEPGVSGSILEGLEEILTVIRQAWDQDDANKAERLLRNLVRRLEHEEPGVLGQHPPRPTARTPALARLHQHRRERARHGAPGHPQRQTLETRRDGAQMDRRRPAGGPENLPSPQGLSPAAHPPKCSPGTLEKGSGRQCR